MGACLLNKHQERRKNDVVMRVERLQKVMEGKYACRLSGVIKYSDVKYWDSNSIGDEGDVKEGLELTLMGSFNVGQGGRQLRTW